MKEDIFKLAAIKFLEGELRVGFNDLKHICSEGRMAGGTYLPGNACCTLGNITGTTPTNPAKNILVEIGNKKKRFNVDEIYKLCQKK